MANDETVTITKKEYEQLLDDAKKLWALESMGVDNWDGWDEAMSLYHEEEE